MGFAAQGARLFHIGAERWDWKRSGGGKDQKLALCVARATASASNGHRRSFSGRGFLCDDGAVDLDVSAHAAFADVTGVGAGTFSHCESLWLVCSDDAGAG